MAAAFGFCLSSRSRWRRYGGRLARACTGVLLAAMGLVCLPQVVVAQQSSAESSEQQPSPEFSEYALQRGLAAFWALRQDLGLPGPEELDGRQGVGDAEKLNRDALAVMDALCDMVGVRRADDCVTGVSTVDELWSRLKERRDNLQSAADWAIEARDRVEGDALTVLDPCGGETCASEDHAQMWWKEAGPQALRLLDAIGRRQILLSRRVGEAEAEDALNHVLQRLTRMLERKNVELVVQHLAEQDEGPFEALGTISDDPIRALEAVAKVPAWIQDRIADRMRAEIEEMVVEDAEVIEILQDALAGLPDGVPIADHLRDKFEESRRSLELLVVFGQALNEDAGCRLPELSGRLNALEYARLGQQELNEAKNGFGRLVEACSDGVRADSDDGSAREGEAAPPGPSNASGAGVGADVLDVLGRSLLEATNRTPLEPFLTPLEAHCRWSDAMAELPDNVRNAFGWVGSPDGECGARSKEKDELERLFDGSVSDDELRERLDEKAPALWVAGRLLTEVLQRRELIPDRRACV